MPPAAQRRLRLADLTPGYFAGVMATGIISIGAHLQGHALLSSVLFWAALVFYAVLIVLNGARLVRHPDRMAQDFRDPSRAFGFFTFIAATNVMAATVLGIGFTAVAGVLLIIAVLGWLVFGYVIPWTAVVGSKRRPMLDTANGTWFIWAVASQSIAVVSAGLEPLLPSLRQILAMLAVLAWSIGLMLYAACAVFVMLRVMLYRFEPAQFDPPYWVAMGAAAISVVAGARIVEMDDAPMIDVTRGVVAGVAVMLWGFATWLIPVLLAAGVWQHVVHRIPLRYEPTMWSLVFPFGMYAVAGIYLGRADHLPIVEIVGEAWYWVALATWTLTAVGMVHDLAVRSVSTVRARRATPAPAPAANG